jgi:hypothetical protein
MGLVLLSPELRVIGRNDFAGKVFGAATAALGRNLLDYHPDKSRARVREIMREMLEAPSGQAKTLIIDVLGKAIWKCCFSPALNCSTPMDRWRCGAICAMSRRRSGRGRKKKWRLS